MKVLGLIPARGGSKGVPRKNIKLLAGKPLIVWTIETSLQASTLDWLVVSTDDLKIADIARQAGAEVPFMRPRHLARDDTPDYPVCRHALDWLASNEDYCPDIVVWLRPTTPLRWTGDIDSAVELLQDTNADCVRSICPVEHHPYWMKRLDGDRLTSFIEGFDENTHYQRQLLPAAYRLNGAVDAFWRDTVLDKGFLYGGDMRGYVMPVERSVDLDTETDFALAEVLLQRRHNGICED